MIRRLLLSAIANAAFAAIVVVAATSSLAANDPETVAKVDNKAIEASIVIDKSIKAYPALYQKLIASSKKAYDDARRSAQEDLKSSPEFFKDDRKYYYQRSYRLRSAIWPFISIIDREETYTGGAHPNHGVDTLMWDTQAGRFVNIKPLFKEMADGGPTLTLIAREIRIALAAEKKARDVEIEDIDKNEWLSHVTPKITEIGGIALAPSTDKGKSSGFIAYFSPYAVGPYAEGEYSVFIPYTGFQSLLSDKGASLFGGTRPAGDDKSD